MVTILLVLGTALFSLSQQSVLHAALAFASGTVVTALALTALPAIWFPLDQYPVAALWVMGVFPYAAVGWLIVTAVGRLTPRFRLSTR